MKGAIIGDIIGSRFEFKNIKRKDFEFFGPRTAFTDDSVMTLAVADALLKYKKLKEKESDYSDLKKLLVSSMQTVGRRYPHCGYGGRFYGWMFSDDPQPYFSYGNGSGMRVSPVVSVAQTLEEAETLAEITACVTHNHPEGIKGAKAVAGAAFLAKKSASKEEIREYVSQYYDIDFTLDEIREYYRFYEICQKSVPQALEAFFEAESFEDAIRNAISIGGDSDTIAAMAGTVAEFYYGIDSSVCEKAKSYLTPDLLEIYDEFISEFGN